jgi:hypothetical protein
MNASCESGKISVCAPPPASGKNTSKTHQFIDQIIFRVRVTRAEVRRTLDDSDTNDDKRVTVALSCALTYENKNRPCDVLFDTSTT